MARNLKKDYLKKLLGIETANGYKIDISNYVYNPSLDNEYPGLKKLTGETAETATYTKYYYFKHYDGSGEYIKEVYTVPKDGKSWVICKQREETTILIDNRFNLKKLIAIAEKEDQI